MRMVKMKKPQKLRNFTTDESGAALVGYALLVTLIALIAIPSMISVQEGVTGENMCKAYAALHLDARSQVSLWQEEWWDDNKKECNLNRHDVFAECQGWPC